MAGGNMEQCSPCENSVVNPQNIGKKKKRVTIRPSSSSSGEIAVGHMTMFRSTTDRIVPCGPGVQ